MTALHPDETTLIERLARATRTRVALVYNAGADESQPWETICIDHGGVCSHETRRLAESHLSHPDEWCEDCMYGPGTLAGDVEVERVETPEQRIAFATAEIESHGFTVRLVDYCEDSRTPGLLGQITGVTDRELREVKIGRKANPTSDDLARTFEHEARHVRDPDWDCGNRDVRGRGGPR